LERGVQKCSPSSALHEFYFKEKIMRRFVTVLAVFSALAFAESWSGKLADAKCVAEQKNAACTPTEATATFVLNAGGKMYKLDDTGNAKAAEALKSQADRSKDPNAAAGPSPVNANVTGTLDGDTIKVEVIAIQ